MQLREGERRSPKSSWTELDCVTEDFPFVSHSSYLSNTQFLWISVSGLYHFSQEFIHTFLSQSIDAHTEKTPKNENNKKQKTHKTKTPQILEKIL